MTPLVRRCAAVWLTWLLLVTAARGQANAFEFDSNATTWDRRGPLKYEVSGSSVIAQMLENPAAIYSRLVRVILDAEL